MSEDLPFIDPVDDCPWLPARELFRRIGYEPLPGSAVDDFQLRGRLWEFIYALAARRFWLHDTDHLSDRALYSWLHDVWFNQEVADIPPEAEWNSHVDPSSDDQNCGLAPVTWLRFYATEAERAAWATDFPGDEMPGSEGAPFDRDRWLPEPPCPPILGDAEEEAFDEDGDIAPEDHRSAHDPLGLAAADAAIEANERREQARSEQREREAEQRERMAAITGGKSEDWRRPIDQLQRAGSLLPPDELTDDTLPAKLWELIHHLACRGFYLLNTNHLSERALYVELWRNSLREKALLPGKIKTGGWYHDSIGSGSEEDVELRLRFFACDEERAAWQREFPNHSLPPKEIPVGTRDWRLPKGPF